jgi:hypothetical protein
MAVADKEQRYSGTIGRYLPFNNFLRDEIQHYLKYLKHFLHLTKALLHKHSKAEFSPIHSNLRHNLGAGLPNSVNLFRTATRMNFIDLTLKMSCRQPIT